MLKKLLFFISFSIMLMMLVSCSISPAATESETPAEPNGQTNPNSIDNAPSNIGEPVYLTEDEAKKIAQDWIDSHPFQLGSELEPESDEYFYDGTEHYPFHLGVVRFGLVEILVHKETGEIFHFMSPGNTTLEPIDDWYYRDHNPDA